MLPHPLNNFEIQNIIKMSLNLMVLIQEIIYLKNVWDICNKSLRLQTSKN